MKSARLKTTIVLAIGCSVGYIAACSNQQPGRDANAAAQQTGTPKSASNSAKLDDQLAQTGSGAATTVGTAAIGQNRPRLIHDAEHYLLEAQHGEKWATEDAAIDRKLAELEKKHGRRPNLIHIMWDDTPLGEVGIPEIQKLRGFETPNMNRMAKEGINFMRMCTEPSCTPTRAAFMTGRYAIRSGMHTVSFPIENSGIDADEVTLAEVMSKAGYATAFYGKWHLGDTEPSYCHNVGFDEAFFTPYNQVPSMWVREMESANVITGLFPEMYGKDIYDIDNSWQPRASVWVLEGTKGGKTFGLLTRICG